MMPKSVKRFSGNIDLERLSQKCVAAFGPEMRKNKEIGNQPGKSRSRCYHAGWAEAARTARGNATSAC
jgi:hypothetical protein